MIIRKHLRDFCLIEVSQMPFYITNKLNLTSTILFFFLSCLTITTFAQVDIRQKEYQIDSLEGNQKYNLMLEIAEAYSDSIPKKSLYYMQVLIKEIGKPSKKQPRDYIIFLADAYYNIGKSYLSLLNSKESEQAFLSSFNISHKYNYAYGKGRAEKTLNDLGINTSSWWDRKLNNLSNLQLNEKIKDATSDIHISAKSLTENIKESRIEKLDANAQEAYTSENYYAALKHYQKALELSKTLIDKENVVKHHLLLAGLYGEIGNISNAIKQYDSVVYVINTWKGEPSSKVFSDSIKTMRKQLKKILEPSSFKNKEITKPSIVQKKQQDSTLISLEDKIYISAENIAEEKKKLALIDNDIKESLQKGDYEKALEYKELYFLSQLKLTRDSTQIIELQAQKDEQEYQIKVQQALIEKEQNEKIQERNAKIFLTVISTLAGVLALVLYYLFITKKKSHGKLQSTYKELKETHKDLKAAQSKLVESEKMASLGQLTAGIAHEINNPINFVSSNIGPLKKDINDLKTFYSAFIKYQEKSSSEIPEYLQNLKEELEVEFLFEEIEMLIKGMDEGAIRTKNIVESFRSFARLDEEGFKIINIQSSIESTLVLLNNKIEDKIIVKTIFNEVPEVECQPGKVNQLLFHVLNNAIQAIIANKNTEKKGEIIINVKLKDENTLLISIQDNGIGIEKGIQSKIFDPFFTTKDVGEGKGLGLSIAFSIVQEHHGEITFKSESEKDSYTIFYIAIPVIHSKKIVERKQKKELFA